MSCHPKPEEQSLRDQKKSCFVNFFCNWGRGEQCLLVLLLFILNLKEQALQIKERVVSALAVGVEQF